MTPDEVKPARGVLLVTGMSFKPFLLCVLLLSSIGVARADDKDVARAAHTEGTRLYNLGDYPAALVAFKRAYLAYESPAFLYNMAQCERQLDHNAESLRLYRSFLRTNPTASERERKDVQRAIEQLEAALAAERVAKGALPVAPPPAPTPAPPPIVDTPSVPITPVVVAPIVARRPLYKKWWLWTAVGAVVVVGAGVGVGVALALRPTHPFNPTLSSFGAGLRF